MKKLFAAGPVITIALLGLVACGSPAPSQSSSPTNPNVAGAQSQPAGQNAPSAASRTNDAAAPASADATVLQIQPGASTASFTVDEILRGSPNTVVGTTNQVSGEIALDANNPAATKVGTITVDARSLATDDNQRNNMLQRFILSTSDFQYVSFTPTSITGLPAAIAPGTAYPVKITGDLTIKDTTKPVTFDAMVTPMSPSELKGTATTTIKQTDFGITIPQIPFVAGVGDDVKLNLDFVATA